MRRTALFIPALFAGLIGCTDDYNRTADTAPVTPPPATMSPPPMTPPADTATPGLPAMSEADRELAANVEKAIREDATLAGPAQNVQVHAQNGQVTLRGSVSSMQEKTDIEAKARQTTGVTGVVNQLEVASASR